jgi:hypothetical protein
MQQRGSSSPHSKCQAGRAGACGGCEDCTRLDGRSSMVDQYAEGSCGQHRTEHDVDCFKCVAVPHQNRASITTTVFKSRTFTGSKFSTLR